MSERYWCMWMSAVIYTSRLPVGDWLPLCRCDLYWHIIALQSFSSIHLQIISCIHLFIYSWLLNFIWFIPFFIAIQCKNNPEPDADPKLWWNEMKLCRNMTICRTHRVSIIRSVSRDSSETQIDDSVSSVFWKECLCLCVIADRRLSNSNLRKRLQGLGSAAYFYAYILLFHFCLLISCSCLLIIPLPGTLHKALRAEKAILAPPKQLQWRQSTETGHTPLWKSVIYLSDVKQ